MEVLNTGPADRRAFLQNSPGGTKHQITVLVEGVPRKPPSRRRCAKLDPRLDHVLITLALGGGGEAVYESPSADTKGDLGNKFLRATPLRRVGSAPQKSHGVAPARVRAVCQACEGRKRQRCLATTRPFFGIAPSARINRHVMLSPHLCRGGYRATHFRCQIEKGDNMADYEQ